MYTFLSFSLASVIGFLHIITYVYLLVMHKVHKVLKLLLGILTSANTFAGKVWLDAIRWNSVSLLRCLSDIKVFSWFNMFF